MTPITKPRSILSVGLNIVRLCFFRTIDPFIIFPFFPPLFELCMPLQNAQFLTSSVPQTSKSNEHASLSLEANFTQNVIFILCCEFRLLFFRREAQTQLLFMPQFWHSWRHSAEIVSSAVEKLTDTNWAWSSLCKMTGRAWNHSSNSVSQISRNKFDVHVTVHR